MQSYSVRIGRMIPVVLALCLCLAGGVSAVPVGQEEVTKNTITLSGTVDPRISYQGRLTHAGGEPLNGTVKLVFQLWDAASGGNKIGGDIVRSNVPVSDGLFMVELDVWHGTFNGQALWLRIQVDDQWLTPRQALLPVPYALSLRPGAVIRGDTPVLSVESEGVSGSLATHVALGGWPPATLPVGAQGKAVGDGIGVDGEASDGATVAVRGRATDSGPVTNYGGYFEALGAAGRGVAGIVSGASAVGVLGEAVGSSGIGVAARHSQTGNYVELGRNDMGLRAIAPLGDAIRGLSSASAKSGVYGVNSVSDGFGIYGRNSATDNFGYLGGEAGAYGEAHSAGGVGVSGRSDSNHGIMGWTGTSTQGEISGVFGHSTQGTGVTGRSVSYNGVKAITQSNAHAALAAGNDGGGPALYARGGTLGVAAVFRGNVAVQSLGTGATILELGEGLDYSEGFYVSDAASVYPGMVLVIDPDNPGWLRISREAYDRRVAGIVSGANGLGSGVHLGGDEFDYGVALAGRVYCRVDGAYGAISPGDLLTSSPTPGYAMVATDRSRAQGAILGKAMESLPAGAQGEILVLVSLQ